jgi:hypothetical protein
MGDFHIEVAAAGIIALSAQENHIGAAHLFAENIEVGRVQILTSATSGLPTVTPLIAEGSEMKVALPSVTLEAESPAERLKGMPTNSKALNSPVRGSIVRPFEPTMVLIGLVMVTP